MKKLLLLSSFLVLLFSQTTYAQCTANFTFQTFGGVIPAYVSFTDSSTGSITSWTWDFGDGSAPVMQSNPTHTYPAPGNYNVCLFVSDGLGCFDTLCQIVIINAPPPVDIQYFFDSIPNYYCTYPDSVLYDFYANTYGYLSTDSAKVEIQFGDGSDSIYYYHLINSGIQGYFNHTYNNAGTYTAMLKITGPDGSYDTAFAQPVVIASTCGNISGTVYQDLNGNCTYDAGTDSLLEYISVAIYDGTNLAGWAFSDSNGVYSFNLPIGITYTIKVEPYNSWYWGHYALNCPVSGIITVSSVPSAGNDFGLICPTAFDLTGWVSGWGFRPGLISSVCVFAYNKYCSSPNGQIELIFSSNVTPLADTAGIGYVVSGNTVTYQMNSSDPYWYFCLPVQVSQTAQIGDSVCITMNITPTAGDSVPSDNSSTHCYAVRNSWDPNDKSVDPAGDGPQGAIHPNTDLNYTIRFQNTGTADALNIYILDTLDASLDASTIQILGASHDMHWTLLTGNIIRFNFDNINLPDSGSNPNASHGYVSFRISQNYNVTHNTVINNSASIYFDFNPPIYTNKTVNTVDHFLSVKELNSTVNQFSVYPNPSKDNCSLYFKDLQKRSIVLTDAVGKIVYTKSFETLSFDLNTSKFAEGSYTISVLDSKNQRSFGQLVVIR